MKRLIKDTKAYIALLLGALVIVTWTFVLGSLPVSDSRARVRVNVPRGTSARTIAAILHEKQLIRSPFVFVMTCALSGSTGNLKPGVYEFTQSMTLPMVIKRLVRGETLESWITVPEGYTARQIADLLAEKQIANPQEFLDLALHRGLEFSEYPFICTPSIEGYLFPDTYLLDKGAGARGVIAKMLDAFETKVLTPSHERIENAIRKRFGYGPDRFAQGLHKVLTVASLIEREAKVPGDRALISAVLWNRLAKNMRLEVDATVTYRPGESRENKNRIYHGDLRADSEYNTYKHFGLPPGPICSPGVAAIQAALAPADVDYLYYVAKPDGSHVFHRTFEEHVKAKNYIRSAKP